MSAQDLLYQLVLLKLMYASNSRQRRVDAPDIRNAEAANDRIFPLTNVNADHRRTP